MVSKIYSLPRRAPVSRLDLSDNLIADVGVHALRSVLAQQQLRTLLLVENAFTADGVRDLAEELAKNTSLRVRGRGLGPSPPPCGRPATSLCIIQIHTTMA